MSFVQENSKKVDMDTDWGILVHSCHHDSSHKHDPSLTLAYREVGVLRH